jgi:chorismate mutase
MKEIEDWRAKIDAVDEALIELLNQRASFVLKIGRIKRMLGEPVYVPEREAEILKRVVTLNKGPLDGDALQRLFEQIIDESRRLEQEEKEPEEVTEPRKISGDGRVGVR